MQTPRMAPTQVAMISRPLVMKQLIGVVAQRAAGRSGPSLVQRAQMLLHPVLSDVRVPSTECASISNIQAGQL